MRRHRRPLRIQKSYDTYEIRSGSAGFIIVYLNGKRLNKKNWRKAFNVPKSK